MDQNGKIVGFVDEHGTPRYLDEGQEWEDKTNRVETNTIRHKGNEVLGR